MATAENGRPAMREDMGSLYGEADKLLRLAEALQEKCERYERTLWMLLTMGASLAAVFLTGAAYFGMSVPGLGTWGYVAAIIGVAYAFAIGSTLYFTRDRIRRRLYSEKRALHSIVDMLRELEKGIANENNLSTLERAEFRIRLSRFDIGPGWSTRHEGVLTSD